MLEGFQPPPLASAIFIAAILVVGNALVILMISLCANGTISRGGLAGIRTGNTRASEAAWEAGHRAATPVTRVGNGIGALLGAATLFAASTVEPYLLLLLAAVAVTLSTVVVATIVAHRAAGRSGRAS